MALRLLSYNILAGGEGRLPLIISLIQKQQADIVALVEADSRDNAEVLAQQLGMSLIYGEGNGKAHVAWLSHLPVIYAQNHPLPALAKTLLEIGILWEGATLPLFATHLKAGQNQEGEQRRVAEIRAILRYIHTLGDQPHLLVGDFNTIHPADQPNALAYMATQKARGEEPRDLQFPRQVIPFLLQAGYVDCYRALHPTTPGYTSHTDYPAVRVDYIFASPAVAKQLYACDLVTGPEAERASDHFPIWAELR